MTEKQAVFLCSLSCLWPPPVYWQSLSCYLWSLCKGETLISYECNFPFISLIIFKGFQTIIRSDVIIQFHIETNHIGAPSCCIRYVWKSYLPRKMALCVSFYACALHLLTVYERSQYLCTYHITFRVSEHW